MSEHWLACPCRGTAGNNEVKLPENKKSRHLAGLALKVFSGIFKALKNCYQIKYKFDAKKTGTAPKL
jgi:hypothetical protein